MNYRYKPDDLETLAWTLLWQHLYIQQYIDEALTPVKPGGG